MPRFCVIYNPTSNKGNSAKILPQVKQELDRYHLDYELKTTQYIGHALELAKQAAMDQFDVVVAAGTSCRAQTRNLSTLMADRRLWSLLRACTAGFAATYHRQSSIKVGLRPKGIRDCSQVNHWPAGPPSTRRCWRRRRRAASRPDLPAQWVAARYETETAVPWRQSPAETEPRR